MVMVLMLRRNDYEGIKRFAGSSVLEFKIRFAQLLERHIKVSSIKTTLNDSQF